MNALVKDATTIKIYGYSFRSRKNLIQQANENSISTLIKGLATRQEKIDLIKERNPLHYAFGERLLVKKGSESYEEFMNRQYIGRI